jgi:hypothetical protein
MASKQQTLLLNRLISKTNKGELEWRAGPTSESFQVALKRNSIRITQTTPELSEHALFTIDVIDSNGDIVDDFTDYDLDMMEFGEANAYYYQNMRDLFESARRRARGADKVLRDVLNELADEDDIPF